MGNRLDAECAVRSCLIQGMYTKESATRKSLDNLPIAGEVSGHGDGDDASTTSRA